MRAVLWAATLLAAGWPLGCRAITSRGAPALARGVRKRCRGAGRALASSDAHASTRRALERRACRASVRQ